MELAHLFGAATEDRASKFLQERGLKLVERNWRCRGGELDLIMRDGAEWVFVEVRHRTNSQFGGALESITNSKCSKLQHAATVSLSQYGIDAPYRFDAVLSDGTQPLAWLKNII